MESFIKTHTKKRNVHKILAHSYFSFFIFFIVSIYLDLVFRLKFFDYFLVAPIGLILLMFATFLVIWAQKTSRSLNKEKITKETFLHGPYRYTRSPTHYGLFFLMLGFGMVTNAFFVILFSFITFLFTKFVFLSKEEEILAEKYGAPYLEYKKAVKL